MGTVLSSNSAIADNSDMEANIIRPKLSQIQSQVRPRPDIEDHRITKFKLMVQEYEDEALDLIRKDLNQDAKGVLLHIAVNSRKNKVIRKVLQRLCCPLTGDGDISCGDEVPTLEKAVFFATFNDDSETLEEILRWANVNQFSLSRMEREHCPLVFSCLRNYARCIDVFCKHGYQ